MGKHGHLTPHDARKMAQSELSRVAKGSDPTEEKKRRLSGETVRDLCELYLERHARIHKKPHSIRSDEYQAKLLAAALGTHKIADVTRLDIEALHHKFRANPYKANRLLAMIRKMFNLAEDWGLRPEGTNPARRIKQYKEHGRERYLENAEFTRLLQVLQKREEERIESPFVTAAFRLLMFTGCRLGEIQTLKWDYVDFERCCLKLPDSKTGAKRVVLNELALKILREIPRKLDNPYVIASEVTNGPVNDMQKPWRRIRKEAELEDVRIHDLRHSFASIAVMNGLSLLEVGRLLGHTQMQTTMRYAHLSLDAQLKSTNRVGETMAALMQQEQESNVIPFRK